MTFPRFEDSQDYDEALSDLRAQKWLEQQRRNGEIDEQLEQEIDDDEDE